MQLCAVRLCTNHDNVTISSFLRLNRCCAPTTILIRLVVHSIVASKPSLLIAVNKSAFRKTLKSYLKEGDYNITFARSCEEALSLAREDEPDIVLLEACGPELNGFEICSLMRTEATLSEVPILLIVSQAGRGQRLKGIEAGADDFIRKPVDRLELLARLRMIARLNQFRNLREEHQQLETALFKLQQAYDATIEGWVQALDLRDKETEGHTRRVTDMTVHLARLVGINEDTIIHYRRGALLHDIGKLGIPDSILNKNGTLTVRERKILKRHTEYAFQWLSRIDYLRPALDIPYCHHEKWDGSGYPRGLKREEIPFAARLFAVVDVWDALLSERPYKSAWSLEQAVEYLKSQKGVHFDPNIVDVFLKHCIAVFEDIYEKASFCSHSLRNFPSCQRRD